MRRSDAIRLGAIRTEAIREARSSEEAPDPLRRAFRIEGLAARGQPLLDPRALFRGQALDEHASVRGEIAAGSLPQELHLRARFRPRTFRIAVSSAGSRCVSDRERLGARRTRQGSEGFVFLAGQRALGLLELHRADESSRLLDSGSSEQFRAALEARRQFLQGPRLARRTPRTSLRVPLCDGEGREQGKTGDRERQSLHGRLHLRGSHVRGSHVHGFQFHSVPSRAVDRPFDELEPDFVREVPPPGGRFLRRRTSPHPSQSAGTPRDAPSSPVRRRALADATR